MLQIVNYREQMLTCFILHDSPLPRAATDSVIDSKPRVSVPHVETDRLPFLQGKRRPKTQIWYSGFSLEA